MKSVAFVIQHLVIFSCTVLIFLNEKWYSLDRPDPPMLTNVVPKIGAAVEITWKMQKDNGDKAFQVYIQAKAHFEGSDWKTIKISNKTSDSKETEVVQLSPWVTYEIALRAENRYGISRRGKESKKSIKTPTAKPTKYPQNLQGIGISPNELRIIFDVSILSTPIFLVLLTPYSYFCSPGKTVFKF